jgi:hypothetical protein
MPEGTIDAGNGPLTHLLEGADGTESEKVKDGRRWLRLHRAQRFILIGDTRMRDPEAYRTLLAEHPDQVALVLIHRAGGPTRDANRFPGIRFFDNYPEAEQIIRSAALVGPGGKPAR